jgi:hypothetical protein
MTLLTQAYGFGASPEERDVDIVRPAAARATAPDWMFAQSKE